MKTLFFCIIFVVSGALIPVIYTFVSKSSILAIKTINVKTGHKAKAEELQLYLREFVGQPLYGVELKAVQKAAQRHPWVAEAIVRRQPPNELEVEIVERQPTALIKQDKLLVVDSQGVAFKTAENEAELSLPLVSGLSDVSVLLAHAQAKHPGGVILEVQNHGVNQHKVIFSSGLEAIVGDKNTLAQWQKLVQVLKSLGEKQNTLAFVYLDDTLKLNQIAVRFKKG
ncbi:MAG: FtsQ-type POTRA domain-containing protein [Myxococcaceae bacterium]